MNKSLLVFALVIATTVAYAQTSAGNMMAGGSIEFNSYSGEGGSPNDASSFTFSPSFGYFISDNFAVGTSLTLGSSRSGTGAGKTTSSEFGIGPFARYYKYTSNENLAIFGQAGLNFETGKSDPSFGAVRHSSAISFSISPGAAYFFNEHWAAEVTITGFRISSSDPDTDNDGDKTTSVAFILSSFSPTLGFRYHF
jgi:hypothetical protein